MVGFQGFPIGIFNNCEASANIRIPINILKQLKLEIEPKLKRINIKITGHVSRTKIPGTNEYNDWAWLYFNTIGRGAYRYSQLTVNISPNRLYVGVNLRRLFEYENFRSEVNKEENRLLFENILNSLSGREWIVSYRRDWWEEQSSRRYTPQEIYGILLNPNLYWINAAFEKNDPMLRNTEIVDEILQTFKELYNIYALASGNNVIRQPKPRDGVFQHETFIDQSRSIPKSDVDIMLETRNFLKSLISVDKNKKYNLPKRKDQYTVKRIALEINLKPYQLDCNGDSILIYSDKNIKSFNDRIMDYYLNFYNQIDRINKLLELPDDFLKIMWVDPVSDARYYRENKSNSILLNLARFENNQNFIFWLFAVARELTYIKTGRLSYRFINKLREILIVALTNHINP